jgi:lipopolysaccharide transport system permease protein
LESLALTAHNFNPLHILRNLWTHSTLLTQLVKRDVLLRYRGAMFGVLWIFLSPLLMLAIFAFVFGHIFQARWPQLSAGIPFWLFLYIGLIVFNVFAESVSRSPTAVRSYPSYVKKIIFPLEILPVVPLGAALVHTGFNFLILVTALAWIGKLHATVFLFPLLLTPLIMFALGLAWFLSAWGVFIKDMTQIVPLMVQMLLFLSPVFYPVQAVPPQLQTLYLHNPLGAVIESCRTAMIGQPMDWASWGWVLALSLVMMVFGYAFFQHSRDEFADVL